MLKRYCPTFPTLPSALAGARLTAEAGQALFVMVILLVCRGERSFLGSQKDLLPKGMVWCADRQGLGAAGREGRAPPYPPPFPQHSASVGRCLFLEKVTESTAELIF